MDYKIQVTVFCPLIGNSFDVLIPIDKKIKNIKFLLKKGISEVYSKEFNLVEYELYNKDTGVYYNEDIILKNTDIRNGTQLVLV